METSLQKDEKSTTNLFVFGTMEITRPDYSALQLARVERTATQGDATGCVREGIWIYDVEAIALCCFWDV
mgnify:FL=1